MRLFTCLLQVGGTFWLTRLARDREAEVRAAALSLLSQLAGPEAIPTRRMLLQGWPEAGSAVLKVATTLYILWQCTSRCIAVCALVKLRRPGCQHLHKLKRHRLSASCTYDMQQPDAKVLACLSNACIHITWQSPESICTQIHLQLSAWMMTQQDANTAAAVLRRLHLQV